MLLLVSCLLLAEARVIDGRQLSCSLALGAIVHQSFDSLFALKTSWLHLIERSVHYLLVHGLELSKIGKINLNIRLLAHQLTDDSEDVVEWDFERLLLEVDLFCHGRVGRLDGRSKHNCRLALKFSHGRAVFEAVGFEEVVSELDIDDFLVFSQRLEADDAKVIDCNSSIYLDLLDTPSVHRNIKFNIMLGI